jgi:hypothetical protein
VANPDLSLRQVKEELGKVRGHLVDMPMQFLAVSSSRSRSGMENEDVS